MKQPRTNDREVILSNNHSDESRYMPACRQTQALMKARSCYSLHCHPWVLAEERLFQCQQVITDGLQDLWPHPVMEELPLHSQHLFSLTAHYNQQLNVCSKAYSVYSGTDLRTPIC